MGKNKKTRLNSLIKDKGNWLNFQLSQPKSDEEEAALLKDLWETKVRYLKNVYYKFKLSRHARSDKNKMKILGDTNIVFEDWLKRLNDFIKENVPDFEKIATDRVTIYGIDEAFKVYQYFSSREYKIPSLPNVLSDDLCYLCYYYKYLAYYYPPYMTFRIDQVMTEISIACSNFCHSIFQKGKEGDKAIQLRLDRKKVEEERKQIILEVYHRHIDRKYLEGCKSLHSLAKTIKARLAELKLVGRFPSNISKVPSIDTIKRCLLKDEKIKENLKNFEIYG